VNVERRLFYVSYLFADYSMSSLYPSLSNNQPAEEVEMNDYPDNGRFRAVCSRGIYLEAEAVSERYD